MIRTYVRTYVCMYVRMCTSFDEGEAGTTRTVSDVGNGSLALVSSRSSYVYVYIYTVW